MVTGGGICQVSTTLYRAVLRAGIMPTERHNHSMTTTYSGPSEDATVSWGSLDYQFKTLMISQYIYKDIQVINM